MLLKSCCTIWTLLWGIAAAAVFVEKHEANSVLRRWRRANSGFLEELKQGNLERECIEEVCSYEEAREVFEDEDQTMLFWLSYDGVHRVLGTLHKSRDPCLINPCYNNGTCINLGNSHKCQCLDGFEGRFCQTVFEDTLKCLYLNGRCEQFCDGSGSRRRCYCADGYVLGDDGRHCVPNVEYPCGRVAPPEIGRNQTPVITPRTVGTYHCPRGNCPWQVLVRLNTKSHCGGVLIHPRWVITAAHCIHGHDPQNLTVVAGEYNLDVDEGTEQEMAVSLAIAHDSYVSATGDSDVALLQLSRAVNLSQHVIPICLPTKDFATRELLLLRYHTVSGWGKRTTGGNVKTLGAPVSPVLRMMLVPILQNSLCSLRAPFNLTENMLCAGYLEGRQESCRGDDGSPLVSLFGSTHFLTGVVGWGRGCGAGYFAVYTNMANFVEWVEKTMKKPPSSPPHSFGMLEQTHT